MTVTHPRFGSELYNVFVLGIVFSSRFSHRFPIVVNTCKCHFLPKKVPSEVGAATIWPGAHKKRAGPELCAHFTYKFS